MTVLFSATMRLLVVQVLSLVAVAANYPNDYAWYKEGGQPRAIYFINNIYNFAVQNPFFYYFQILNFRSVPANPWNVLGVPYFTKADTEKPAPDEPPAICYDVSDIKSRQSFYPKNYRDPKYTSTSTERHRSGYLGAVPNNEWGPLQPEDVNDFSRYCRCDGVIAYHIDRIATSKYGFMQPKDCEEYYVYSWNWWFWRRHKWVRNIYACFNFRFQLWSDQEALAMVKSPDPSADFTCSVSALEKLPNVLGQVKNVAQGVFRECSCIGVNWGQPNLIAPRLLPNLVAASKLPGLCKNLFMPDGYFQTKNRLNCTHQDNDAVTAVRSCDQNSYGRLCDKKCTPGSAECLAGTCTANGDCLCFPGFEGDNCDKNNECYTSGDLPGDRNYACAIEITENRAMGKTALAGQRKQGDSENIDHFAMRSFRSSIEESIKLNGVFPVQSESLVRRVPRCRSMDFVRFEDVSFGSGPSAIGSVWKEHNIETDSKIGTAGFGCLCQGNKFGVNCDQEMPICEAEPCVHGLCQSDSGSAGGFNCKCDTGFYGERCEKNLVKNLGFQTDYLPRQEFRSALNTQFLPLSTAGSSYVNVLTVGFILLKNGKMPKITVNMKPYLGVSGFDMVFDLKNKLVTSSVGSHPDVPIMATNFFTRDTYSYDKENAAYFNTHDWQVMTEGWRTQPQLGDKAGSDSSVLNSNIDREVRIVMHDIKPVSSQLSHAIAWRIYINHVVVGFFTFDFGTQLQARRLPHLVSVRPEHDDTDKTDGHQNIKSFFAKVQRQVRGTNLLRYPYDQEEPYQVVTYGASEHRSARDPRLVRLDETMSFEDLELPLSVGPQFRADPRRGPTCTLDVGKVLVDGKVRFSQSPEIGDAVAYLPKECRPAADMVFRAQTSQLLMVRTDGKILIRSNDASLSLDSLELAFQFLQPLDPNVKVLGQLKGQPNTQLVMFKSGKKTLCEIQGIISSIENDEFALPIECDPKLAPNSDDVSSRVVAFQPSPDNLKNSEVSEDELGEVVSVTLKPKTTKEGLAPDGPREDKKQFQITAGPYIKIGAQGTTIVFASRLIWIANAEPYKNVDPVTEVKLEDSVIRLDAISDNYWFQAN